jgi:quinol monooxygenase YgiN
MATPLLTVVAHMWAQSGNEDALRQTLMTLVEPTRREEGCVQYDLHEQNGRPGHFVFFEIWKSQADLDKHMATPHFTAVVPLIPELCSQPPEILTYTRIA